MLANFKSFLSVTMASNIQALVLESGEIGSPIAILNDALAETFKKVQCTISFKHYTFSNDDLKNVFENVPQATTLSFNECDLFKINESFSIEPRTPLKIEKLRFFLTFKKGDDTGSNLMMMFAHLAKTLSKTKMVKTLKVIEINEPRLKNLQVKRFFESFGFQLRDVINAKSNDILIF